MVQWLELGIFTVMVQVQSLVRELKSYKPRMVAQKKKKKKRNVKDIIFTTVGRNPLEKTEQPSRSTKGSKMRYLDAISKTTE